MAGGFTALGLFLTENCNLACSYCFAKGREPRNIDPALAALALERVLDWDQPRLSLTLWGGEPLLRFGLLKRVVAAARWRAAGVPARLHISVPTNATLLDRERLEYCIANEVGLSLSVDGDEQTQRLRPLAGGRSSFPAALAALELVTRVIPRERRPGIRMTIAPETAPLLAHNVRFFLELGFDHIVFEPVLEEPWPAPALAALEEQLAEVGGILARAIRSGEAAPPALMPLARHLRSLRHRDLGAPIPMRVCGAGYTMASVDIHGGIHPCHRFVFYARSRGGEPALGTVEGGWSEQVRQRYKAAFPPGPRALGRCAGCPAEGICEFACVAVSYACTADPAAVPASVCEVLARQAAAARAVHTEIGDEPAYFRYLASLERRLDDPTLRLIETARRNMGSLADRALAKLERQRRRGPGEA